MPINAGYSGTHLAKKLGIKEGFNCLYINTPDHYFDLFDILPDHHEMDASSVSNQSVDFIHAFFQFQNELLKQWDFLKSKLKKDGILWISWPKGKSKLETDLNGNIVREIGLEGGLVDVKVCAVDEDWSGLKFMYRKEDR